VDRGQGARWEPETVYSEQWFRGFDGMGGLDFDAESMTDEAGRVETLNAGLREGAG